jgi:hypothetical protein
MKTAIAILFLLVGMAFAVQQYVTCSQHSVQAKWTGEIRGGGATRECEYSHTYGNDLTGYKTHKFWVQCGN